MALFTEFDAILTRFLTLFIVKFLQILTLFELKITVFSQFLAFQGG